MHCCVTGLGPGDYVVGSLWPKRGRVLKRVCKHCHNGGSVLGLSMSVRLWSAVIPWKRGTIFQTAIAPRRWNWPSTNSMKNRGTAPNNSIRKYGIRNAPSTIHHYLFNRRTRTVYLYYGCLAWYNVLITSPVHSSVTSQFLNVRQTKCTSVDSCDSELSVLNHCLSWLKFVNTHLSHSRQWFNIHLHQKLLYAGPG